MMNSHIEQVQIAQRWVKHRNTADFSLLRQILAENEGSLSWKEGELTVTVLLIPLNAEQSIVKVKQSYLLQMEEQKDADDEDFEWMFYDPDGNKISVQDALANITPSSDTFLG